MVIEGRPLSGSHNAAGERIVIVEQRLPASTLEHILQHEAETGSCQRRDLATALALEPGEFNLLRDFTRRRVQLYIGDQVRVHDAYLGVYRTVVVTGTHGLR